MDTQAKLKVKVFSPYESFFEGSAVSLSAENKTGSFDVLVGHTNFFAVLNPGKVSVDTGFEPVTIQINSGILQVHDDVVTLFANV
jgi:F0F1-type ATP synthase epsilon subunit